MKKFKYLCGFILLVIFLISCENKELYKLQSDYQNLKREYDDLMTYYKKITEYVADELILKDFGNDINEIEKRADGYVKKYGSQFKNVYVNKYNTINNNKTLFKKLNDAGKI